MKATIFIDNSPVGLDLKEDGSVYYGNDLKVGTVRKIEERNWEAKNLKGETRNHKSRTDALLNVCFDSQEFWKSIMVR